MGVSAGAAWAFGIVGVLATVAIVTTIIIIRRNRQKKLTYRSNNTVSHNGVNYTYDPETKCIVESGAPVSNKNDSNSNLRKRPVASKKETSSNENCQNSSNSKVTKEVQTDPVDTVNLNGDHSKTLPDKIVMPMSVEEKVNNYLSGGIRTSDSQSELHPEHENNLDALSTSSSANWSNLSSEKSSDSSRKAYKKKIHKSFEKYVTNMIQNNLELQAAGSGENLESDTLSESSDTSSTSSSWSNISSEKSADDFQKAYKKRVHKTLKRFVDNMNKTSTAPSECSEESEFSVISEATETCKTCKQNPVNCCMQPCMHRYLCHGCATKIFELYKKCKVCRARIEAISLEE